MNTCLEKTRGCGITCRPEYALRWRCCKSDTPALAAFYRYRLPPAEDPVPGVWQRNTTPTLNQFIRHCRFSQWPVPKDGGAYPDAYETVENHSITGNALAGRLVQTTRLPSPRAHFLASGLPGNCRVRGTWHAGPNPARASLYPITVAVPGLMRPHQQTWIECRAM